MKLVTRPNGKYVFDQTVVFVDEARGLDVSLCDVANCVLSNTPYAPDEHYSFSMKLYERDGALYAEVEQEHRTIEGPTLTRTLFCSKDNGATWSVP